jgi:hypothetical protein
MPVAPLFDVATLGDDYVITNAAFWPDISLNDFKAGMRVVDKNAEPLLLALQGAMWAVNKELSAWRDEQVLLGYTTLDLVPVDSLQYVSAYQLAVYHGAKGALLDRYRDVDTTNTGHDKASDLELNAVEHHRQSRRFTRMIQGLPTVAAALL